MPQPTELSCNKRTRAEILPGNICKIATTFIRQRDKQQHIALAAVLTLLGILLGFGTVLSVTTTLTLGTLKELWDARFGTGYSWADQLANLIGSVLGLIVAHSILHSI